MNVITRGMRNALRSPVRSGAIIIMLAISMGLVLAMLVARTSIDAKIAAIKATTATGITINPAGVSGGFGGGNPFTADQIKIITKAAHITNVSSQLTDQMGSTDSNLVSSLTLGSFGKRMMRFESSDGPSTNSFGGGDITNRPAPIPHISVTGTSNPSSVVAADKITSGSTIDGSSHSYVALVGSSLAQKNSLDVGSTFTAYGQTVTVKGIFSSGNTFQDSGIVMPLSTVQTLTGQTGAVSSVTANADNSDDVASVVSALKSSLGSAADITSQQQEAQSSVQPLESIANLALAGVIGAAIAGAVIILLSMIMIVRERRREIGVIKAIGGTNAKVITQFVTEALTLTIIGAIVGLGLGVAVSGPMTQSLASSDQGAPIQSTPEGVVHMMGGNGGGFVGGFRSARVQLTANIQAVQGTLTPQTFATSIGIILLITIVGSAVPAWAIARVRPAEVLRTE